jgi:hypothetical protein
MPEVLMMLLPVLRAALRKVIALSQKSPKNPANA